MKTSAEGDQRRVHRSTAEGEAFLEAHRASLAELRARMPGGRSPEVEAQMREVRGAMDRLKGALRGALSSDRVDADRLGRIVATIDRAARDVETEAS